MLKIRCDRAAQTDHRGPNAALVHCDHGGVPGRQLSRSRPSPPANYPTVVDCLAKRIQPLRQATDRGGLDRAAQQALCCIRCTHLKNLQPTRLMQRKSANHEGKGGYVIRRAIVRAWFKNAHFQVTMRTLDVPAGVASRVGPQAFPADGATSERTACNRASPTNGDAAVRSAVPSGFCRPVRDARYAENAGG